MHSSLIRLVCLCVALAAPLAAQAGPVNVNTADAAQIAKELKGIGLTRAQAIVQYRDKNGPFKSAEDLRKVKGFGPKMLERNRANIRVGNGAGNSKAAKSAEVQAAAEQ